MEKASVSTDSQQKAEFFVKENQFSSSEQTLLLVYIQTSYLADDNW